MKYDNPHFNRNLISPKKQALNKIIKNTKTGCRLAMTEENARALHEWSGKWRQAVCFLQVINALDIFARRHKEFTDILKHCRGRTSLGTNEFREAYGFAGRALEAYRDEFLDRRKD